MTQKILLSRVAEKTKIQEKYLQDLEDENYHKLPADVYARGFLEKYANFLGLDAEPIISQYFRERNIALKIVNQEAHIPLSRLRMKRIIVTPKNIAISALALFFLLAVGFLFYHWSFMLSGPKLEINIAPDQITQNSIFVLIGKTDAGNGLTINDKKIYIEKDGSFKTDLNLNEGENTINIYLKNSVGRIRSGAYKIIYKK